MQDPQTRRAEKRHVGWIPATTEGGLVGNGFLRPFQTMTKAKDIMRKKGITSKVEKMRADPLPIPRQADPVEMVPGAQGAPRKGAVATITIKPFSPLPRGPAPCQL